MNKRISRKQLASLTWNGLCKQFPNTHCSLDSDNPERLAIRGILSAQCTDVRVNIVAKELFNQYPTMDDVKSLSMEEICEIIRPCGLIKSKGNAILSFANLYCSKWNRCVPNDVEMLTECPGVGRKIANLIVGEIYGTPAVVVDTHCKRVMYRIGITDETDPLKVEKDLCKYFPEETWIDLGHRAVDLGRSFCTAKNPSCDTCPLSEFCKKRVGA
ncbi:MAG: endonuclease III [Saccharofermentans sp.]|nr:endonuclease III [Saccharofermentans sp.]